MENKYQNWQLKVKNNIVWLYFDRANSSTNTINHIVLDEFADILTNVTNRSDVQGLIIASAKTNGFIAGADIEEISQLKTRDEILKFICQGQNVFDQLSALKIPTVALIKGFCVGGGLELALACRYRIAIDDAKTRLGLPEVLLGIQPGWGGSVRLPRLIGAPKAMDLILTGRTIDARAAAKIGLVDATIPERDAERAVLFYVQKQPKPHRPSWLQRITNDTLIRPAIARILRRKTAEKVSPEHYPAPFAVINHWEEQGVDAHHAFDYEAESVTNLALTKTARNLIRVFFLRERLKGFGKQEKQRVQHVHVVGAGTMGGDIAAWCALQGMTVTLQDREPKFIAPAIKRAYDLYKKKLKAPRAIQAAMDRLIPDIKGNGITKADVIIEAIYENLEAKQKVFEEAEKIGKPNAILATNTSSIPLDEINQVLQHPERLVGIHFFNPVAYMQLVEVVKGNKTSTETLDKALAFVRQIDKLPLPVKSSPGFLVNRLLMPYLMSAVVLLQEGVPAAVIDKAAVKFGMPMGPIELADTVGLDICLAVAKILSVHFHSTVPPLLEKMVAEGNLGRKTGKGFYKYKNGKPVKEKVAADHKISADLVDRLIDPMYAEAKKCLQEQVVADDDLIDAGMIFGSGFAPFRGGLMQYEKNKQGEK